MRKLTLLVAALLALAAAPQALAATVNVSITRAGFVPDPVTVRVGDTVVWTNRDTQNRQVVSQQAGFASPVLRPGETFSFTFRTAGRFSYEDPLLRPRERGTVVVQAAPATVTIAARTRTVVYGNAATLAGTVSTQQAGERVTVFAQACGGAFTRVADVTTTAGGAWTFSVKPLNNTVYRVQWRNEESATVTVRVRPRLRLARLAPGRFSLRATAAASFAGKAAVFQRFNRTRGVWVNVRRVTLRATATGIAPTVVSAATFRARVGARVRVRAILPQAQVGACYVAGRSNVVLS